MATFNTSKFIPVTVTDLANVVDITKQHFERQGYTVESESTCYGYFISMTKGNIFKAVLGMKTALNIDLQPVSGGVSVDAKVGIFGQQLIPSLIMLFVAWPVMLTQITGLVQQSKLDDEAIQVIESALLTKQNTNNSVNHSSDSCFCTSCGGKIATNSKFCNHCGAGQS